MDERSGTFRDILWGHANGSIIPRRERIAKLLEIGAPDVIIKREREIEAEYQATIDGTGLFEFKGNKKYAFLLDEEIIEQGIEDYKDFKNGKCKRLWFRTISGKFMWMPATKTVSEWKEDKYLKGAK